MSLPEDIENIEDFYRQQLGDLEIAPSNELWNKIETSIQPKPMFGTAAKLGFASVAVITVVATIYFWPKEQTEIRKIDTPRIIETPKQVEILESKPVKTKQIERTISTKITKTTTSSETEKVDLQTNTYSEPIAIPEKIDEPITIEENQKAMPIMEEEKPLSYYEKMKKKGKDSLRPIFVPKK